MSSIFLIRHGRPASTWGDEKIGDPGLDLTGKSQAEAASRALMAIPEQIRPKFVVSSPLARCRETAEPFARALGVDLEIDPLFGEVPTPASIRPEARSAWLKQAFAGTWEEIDGDQDYNAWRKSIVEGLKQRADTAVFSHFVAINGIVSVLEDSDQVLTFRPGHASITRIDIGGGQLRVVTRGDEAHTQVL